jgi:Flp pilus assembly protein TadG
LINKLLRPTRYMPMHHMRAEFAFQKSSVMRIVLGSGVLDRPSTREAGAVRAWPRERDRHARSLRWRWCLRLSYPALPRDRATAALEFALATPLLVLMMGGAADYGLAQFYRTNLANAVAAGAEYAYLTGTGVSTANIQTVIQDAMYLPAGAVTNLTVTFSNVSPGVPSPGWYCVTGSGPAVASSTQGSVCSDLSAAGYYISFRATYVNTGLLSGVLATSNRSISEQVTVRLQ